MTLDAEIKEKLCEDEPAVRALIEQGKSGDMESAYGVVTTMVNLTNSFEKMEINPEMLELAKFAKHHIPEEHELDDPDFIDKRIFVSTYLLLFIYYSISTCISKCTHFRFELETKSNVISKKFSHKSLKSFNFSRLCLDICY